MDFLVASLRPKSRSIRAGIPNITSPILAARGSPSNIELHDQAMQKRSKKVPKPNVTQVPVLNFSCL